MANATGMQYQLEVSVTVRQVLDSQDLADLGFSEGLTGPDQKSYPQNGDSEDGTHHAASIYTRCLGFGILILVT